MERYRRTGQELYASLYKNHIQVKNRNIVQQLSVADMMFLDYPQKSCISELR